MQRMNLDGSDKMVAAYEVSCCEASGTVINGSHIKSALMAPEKFRTRK